MLVTVPASIDRWPMTRAQSQGAAAALLCSLLLQGCGAGFYEGIEVACIICGILGTLATIITCCYGMSKSPNRARPAFIACWVLFFLTLCVWVGLGIQQAFANCETFRSLEPDACAFWESSHAVATELVEWAEQQKVINLQQRNTMLKEISRRAGVRAPSSRKKPASWTRLAPD
eukprot:s3501_g9.t1